MPVVRYDYYGVFKIEQIIFKPAHRLNIKVVCGLVQKEYIGVSEQSLGKQYFHLSLCVEICHKHVVALFANSERGEQGLGFVFGFPTSYLGKFALEFRSAYAVALAEVLLCVQRVLFVHYLYEPPVAKHDCAKHSDVVERILVLLQHGHPFGLIHGNVALVRLNFAAQYLQKS